MRRLCAFLPRSTSEAELLKQAKAKLETKSAGVTESHSAGAFVLMLTHRVSRRKITSMPAADLIPSPTVSGISRVPTWPDAGS